MAAQLDKELGHQEASKGSSPRGWSEAPISTLFPCGRSRQSFRVQRRVNIFDGSFPLECTGCTADRGTTKVLTGVKGSVLTAAAGNLWCWGSFLGPAIRQLTAEGEMSCQGLKAAKKVGKWEEKREKRRRDGEVKRYRRDGREEGRQ